MILLKRNYLHFFFGIAQLFLLIIGILAYVVINKVNGFEEEKFYSETIIFVMILFLIVINIVYFIVFRKNIKLLKEIDKIIDMSKYGNFDIGKSLVKFDKIGVKLKDLYYQLSLLNEQKSLKISSMSNILNFMLEKIEQSIIILDVEGSIMNCSGFFYKKYDVDQSSILYNKLIPSENISLDEIIHELMTYRSEVVKKGLKLIAGQVEFKSDVTFHPVFTIKNELANIICRFDRITGFHSR